MDTGEMSHGMKYLLFKHKYWISDSQNLYKTWKDKAGLCNPSTGETEAGAAGEGCLGRPAGIDELQLQWNTLHQ